MKDFAGGPCAQRSFPICGRLHEEQPFGAFSVCTKVVVTASWHLLLTNNNTKVPDRTPCCTISYVRPPAAVEGGVSESLVGFTRALSSVSRSHASEMPPERRRVSPLLQMEDGFRVQSDGAVGFSRDRNEFCPTVWKVPILKGHVVLL